MMILFNSIILPNYLKFQLAYLLAIFFHILQLGNYFELDQFVNNGQALLKKDGIQHLKDKCIFNYQLDSSAKIFNFSINVFNFGIHFFINSVSNLWLSYFFLQCSFKHDFLFVLFYLSFCKFSEFIKSLYLFTFFFLLSVNWRIVSFPLLVNGDNSLLFL